VRFTFNYAPPLRVAPSRDVFWGSTWLGVSNPDDVASGEPIRSARARVCVCVCVCVCQERWREEGGGRTIRPLIPRGIVRILTRLILIYKPRRDGNA